MRKSVKREKELNRSYDLDEALCPEAVEYIKQRDNRRIRRQNKELSKKEKKWYYDDYEA
jgi:hypothetical protein